MSPDEVVMFFLIVVGLPVTVGVGSHIYKLRLDFKTKQLAAISHETAEKAAQYAAQSERLEQRVRVLERVITDKGFDVSQQIEDLRETPKIEELN
jgi:hypothetical protein